MIAREAPGAAAVGEGPLPGVRVWTRRVATGAENMALDEAAMELARGGGVVVRVYGWDPPCISLGRNQPAAERFAGRPRADLVPGVDIVRRPTGGRSVYHGPELTYAFVAPERFLGGPRAMYAAVHGALRSALEGLGVPLDAPAGRADRGPDAAADSDPVPDAAGSVDLALDDLACFVAPAPGEILAGGRKLVGSAQWRHAGAILQHGSILIENRQELAAPTADGGTGAIGLTELMDPAPDAVVLGAAIEAGLARLPGLAGLPDGPPASGRRAGGPSESASPDLLQLITRLTERNRDPGWIWRR